MKDADRTEALVDEVDVDLTGRPWRLAPTPEAVTTLRLAFRARPSRRARVLASDGACHDEDDGWLVALVGPNLVVWQRLLGVTRGGSSPWPSTMVDDDAESEVHSVDLHVEGGRRIARAWLDGEPVSLAARAERPFRTHGEVPAADGITVGGFADRAGGHTDVRFGVDDDERIVRVRLSRGRGAPRAYRGPVPRPTRAGQGPQHALVFAAGEDGYAGFRVPGIVRTVAGDLMAFAEGRRDSLSDACLRKDLVAKRSRDGGRSWLGLEVVARHPDPAGGSVMNPSPVVDHVHGTGRIFVVFSELDGDEWAVQDGRARARLAWTASDDGGRGWRDPTRLDDALGEPPNLADVCPAWTGRRPGMQVPPIGHGIQLMRTDAARGRLLFVGNVTYGTESVFASVNRAFWTDDLGRSWQAGPAIARRVDGRPAIGLNEASLAELGDATIYVSSRDYERGRPAGLRAATRGRIDTLGRLTFEAAARDAALIDSGVQGSVLGVDDPHGENGRILLFVNPAHPTARRDLTLRSSVDAGRTWTTLSVVHPGSAGYSDLVELDGGRVGVLFERGRDGDIVFATPPVGCSGTHRAAVR